MEKETPSAQQSFHEIAASAVADPDPTPEAGQAEVAPEPEAKDTEEAPASVDADDGKAPEADPDKAEQAPSEEFLPLDLRGLDRDKLPEELQPTYDRLVDAYKSMQANLTPKLMEGAKAKEERDALEKQVAYLSDRLEKIVGTSAAPSAAGEDDGLTYGLKGITWADVKVSPDPDLYAEWVREQAIIEGRRAARDLVKGLVTVLSPRLQQVEDRVDEFSSRELRVESERVEEFLNANPDVRPFRADMASLMEVGLAKDLTDAAEQVRAIRLGPEREAKLLAQAARVLSERQQAVKESQDKFTVPSAATSPNGAPKIDASMSFKDIASAAVGEI